MIPIIPIEGIDKIKVFLNPLFINNTKLKVTKHIDPQNRLTLHQSGCFTSLSIHAEFLNPMIDYHVNIALAIYELIKKGIITFPDNPFTLSFIKANLHWFILVGWQD